jgi:hypothetical protein
MQSNGATARWRGRWASVGHRQTYACVQPDAKRMSTVLRECDAEPGRLGAEPQRVPLKLALRTGHGATIARSADSRSMPAASSRPSSAEPQLGRPRGRTLRLPRASNSHCDLPRLRLVQVWRGGLSLTCRAGTPRAGTTPPRLTQTCLCTGRTAPRRAADICCARSDAPAIRSRARQGLVRARLGAATADSSGLAKCTRPTPRARCAGDARGPTR